MICGRFRRGSLRRRWCESEGDAMSTKTLIGLSALFLCAGCVSNSPQFDTSATETDGVLIERKFVGSGRQPPSGASMIVPIGGAFVHVPLFGPGPVVDWYRHDVRLNGGRMISVVAQGDVHKVGDCVRVFEQPKNSSYPRISYGSSCDK
jgi:hypothetical protein